MRILVVSNLGPTAADPFGGVFIAARLEGLRAAGNDVSLALPLVTSLSTRSTDLLRRTSRSHSTTVTARVNPTSAQLRWRPVPTRIREWERWSGLAGYPEPLARRVADRVLATLDRSDFDVVQGHGMYEFWAGGVAREIARRLGVPFTVSLHGSDVNELFRWRRFAFRRVAEEAAALFFVSDALRRTAGDLALVPGASEVTPNGVDGAVFRPEGRSESTSLRMLFVGGLVPVKGADRLPGIVREVQHLEPSARLRVIGDGSMRAKLEKQLESTGTEFLGRVAPDTVADSMRSADVVLIPSRNEGWSCVALEAQACGARVVATDVGGLPESVGSGGELVPAEPFRGDLAAAAVLQQWRRIDIDAIAHRAADYDWRKLGARESDYLHALTG